MPAASGLLQLQARWWRQALHLRQHLNGRGLSTGHGLWPSRRAPLLHYGPQSTTAAQPADGRSLRLNSVSDQAGADFATDAQQHVLPDFCSGCGVRLQSQQQDRAGYFQLPKNWGVVPEEELSGEGEEDGVGAEAVGAEEDGYGGGDEAEIDEDEMARMNAEIEEMLMAKAKNGWERFEIDGLELDMKEFMEDQEEQQSFKKSKGGREDDDDVHLDVSDWGGEEDEEGGARQPPLFCARCYSLTHYGKVKSPEAEGRLPDFDIGKKVGQKIKLRRFRRSVIVAVVDIADFDGSLPRAALDVLMTRDYETGGLKAPKDTDLVLAINKADLLPAEATRTRLETWVRLRCKQGGIPKPKSVHLVSSTKGTGVKGLLKTLGDIIGRRGDVYVVGAQNSGKSSLINALRLARKKAAGTKGQMDPKQLLTIAPVPGTTLGMVPVRGIMPTGCQMFDTPGVPHPFQLTSILTAEESKMLLASRKLKPRTYRCGSGSTLMLGAVGRLDVLEAPAATLYMTVWASDELSTHLGRTEGAGELWGKHAGRLLVPPIGDDRVEALGRLEPHEILVKGDSWSKSTVDISIAGLGWVGVGVNGSAAFRVWAPEGVAVTTHRALLYDYASSFCKPGFSTAVGASVKKGQRGRGDVGGQQKGKRPEGAKKQGKGGLGK